MLRGLPHWLWDGWDGVRFCANLAGAEPGTRPNDEPGDPRRLHRRLARGPPPARLPSRLLEKGSQQFLFLCRCQVLAMTPSYRLAPQYGFPLAEVVRMHLQYADHLPA